MDTLSWVCYPKEIHLIPCVLVICKLQCWHRIDHKFSMHEILDDVTPCFHFHAQPLYHNLDIWPCFGHSKEYDFDNLLPECLFYCKNKKKLVCYNIIYSSTIVSVKSKLKKSYYTILCQAAKGIIKRKIPLRKFRHFFLLHTKHFRCPIRHYLYPYDHFTYQFWHISRSSSIFPSNLVKEDKLKWD